MRRLTALTLVGLGLLLTLDTGCRSKKPKPKAADPALPVPAAGKPDDKGSKERAA